MLVTAVGWISTKRICFKELSAFSSLPFLFEFHFPIPIFQLTYCPGHWIFFLQKCLTTLCVLFGLLRLVWSVMMMMMMMIVRIYWNYIHYNPTNVLFSFIKIHLNPIRCRGFHKSLHDAWGGGRNIPPSRCKKWDSRLDRPYTAPHDGLIIRDSPFFISNAPPPSPRTASNRVNKSHLLKILLSRTGPIQPFQLLASAACSLSRSYTSACKNIKRYFQ